MQLYNGILFHKEKKSNKAEAHEHFLLIHSYVLDTTHKSPIR